MPGPSPGWHDAVAGRGGVRRGVSVVRGHGLRSRVPVVLPSPARRGLVLLFALMAAFGFAEAPPRSISRPQSEVDDLFFAYIVGVLMADAPMDVDGATLLRMFPEFLDGGAQVPFLDIAQVKREPHAEDDGARIMLRFFDRIEYPVPVDILGYHPGTVFFSRVVTFEESSAVSPDQTFDTIRLVRVRSGELGIDFDLWLDILLGGWVEDVSARVLVVCRYNDHWYALMGGDTPDGGWITGVYDLRESRIVVRPPRPLRELGQQLGKTGESDAPGRN